MTDKKDNSHSEESRKPKLTTSSSLDKPLLDKDTPEVTADIDTSHLSLEESTDQSASTLGSEEEVEVPAIDTSFLSLENEEKTAPASTGSDDIPDELNFDGAEIIEEISLEEPGMDNDDLSMQDSLARDVVRSGDDSASGSDAGASVGSTDTDADQVMLTTNVPDADFEQEMHQDATDDTSTEPVDTDKEEDSDNPIKSILDTVKKPETVVRNAWTNSSARRFLLDNVESLRVKDEEQNMESVIEKVYGGAVEKKIAPGKFLKENLLFSFLLFLLLFLVGWKAAEIFFPEFMPAINDQIIETVQKTTSRKSAEKKEEKKPVVTNFDNKAIIEATLSHCLIEPKSRIAFNNAFSPVGFEFSDRALTLSYEEVKDTIKIWEEKNMDYYIKDAVDRFSVLSGLSQAVVQDAHKTVADYKQSLEKITAQASALQDRIRKIQTDRGNQSTRTINQRIPLRNQLAKLNARLAVEPGLERFEQLLEKLAIVEKTLSGKEIPARIEPDQLTVKDPKWLISTAETAADKISEPVRKNVLPAIQEPADELKKVFPKLTGFHLSQLDKALDDLLKLSALIIYLPENMLIPYKLELSGLNRRLNETMSKELPAWMSFDRCLAKQRREISGSTD